MIGRISRLLSTVAPSHDPDPDRADEARRWLQDFFRQRQTSGPFDLAAQPADYPAGRTVLESDPACQIAYIRVSIEWGLDLMVRWTRRSPVDHPSQNISDLWLVSGLTNQLMRRRQPYTDDDICWLLRCLVASGADWQTFSASDLRIHSLLRGIQQAVDGRGMAVDEHRLLERLRANIADAERTADGRKTLALVDTMLGKVDDGDPLIDLADDWGQFASESLAAMDDPDRTLWLEMLHFAATASGSKPSKTWLQQARQQVDRVGTDRFVAIASDWLRLLDRPTRNGIYRRPDGETYPTALVAETNADLLKGIAWTCSVVADDRLARAVADAGIACYRKLPNIGARCTRGGNACISALGAVDGFGGVSELQRMLQRITLPSARKQIESAIGMAAARNGLTRVDLDDLAVPEFGLREGVTRSGIGTFIAEIAIEASGDASLRWLRPDGKAQATVPAEVKREHAAELKAVQTTLKDLRAALPAHRSRLESMLLADRRWSFERWRDRYLEHPLMSHFARHLIWTFEREGHTVAGCWLDGQLVDLDDGPLDWLDEATTVRLWHPIAAEPDSVLGWRMWLERHQRTQPFKQAHREVYILTDAERETATYTNRFAAHILRQHQLAALCQQRGWAYRLQGGWDGANVPVRDIPEHDLRVEFWVDTPGGTEAAMSAHGIYLYVATDQVRFSRPGAWQPLPLEEVPPLVFSEIMRDVDLFVGVCSVGADPNWFDGGADGRIAGWDQYWWDFSFGDLSAMADTRREVLVRLLPRLAIAGRCTLEGRFLTVRGDLRTYRIHIGSGNVLMEPNDQYLCVVPGGGLHSRGSDQIFLPFEGDATLSVILSKAYLLADDRSITDPTIVRQIQPVTAVVS